MSDILSFLETALLGFVFVGLGLVMGIIGWRKNKYRMMYGGFGHFLGTAASFFLAFMADRQETGNGTAIIIIYPIFVGVGLFAGLRIGTSKERALKK